MSGKFVAAALQRRQCGIEFAQRQERFTEPDCGFGSPLPRILPQEGPPDSSGLAISLAALVVLCRGGQVGEVVACSNAQLGEPLAIGAGLTKMLAGLGPGCLGKQV